MSWLDVAIVAVAASLIGAVLARKASGGARIAVVCITAAVLVPVVRWAVPQTSSETERSVEFPSVVSIEGVPTIGAVPSSSGLSRATVQRVEQSVVKIASRSCGQQVIGTGWFVAPGMIVTNGHVVAGTLHPDVVGAGSRRYRSNVVAFDPVLDVAVLRTDLVAPSLALRDGPQVGVFGVFGHPRGKPLRVAPAGLGATGSIDAKGTDIYGRGAYRRPIMVLATKLVPGDSGSPVVNLDGDVVGMTFAIDPKQPGVGYALEASAMRRLLATIRPNAASLQAVPRCLAS